VSPAPARRRGAVIAPRHLDPAALNADAVLDAARAYPVPLVLPTGWHQQPRPAAAMWIYTGLGADHRPDLLMPLSARTAEQWPRAAAQIEQDWSGNIGGLLLVRAARALLDPTFPAPAPAQLAVHLDDYQLRLLTAAVAFTVRGPHGAADG